MTQDLKIRAYLMQNFMELDMKKFSYPKAQSLWPKAFGKGLIKVLAEDISSHKSRTLALIFTNRTSFSQES